MWASIPPSTPIDWPVTNSPSSEQRNTAMAATSSGRPGHDVHHRAMDILHAALGADEAGVDRVAADPLLAELRGDVAGQAHDRGFRGAVRDVGNIAKDSGARGRHHD